ncbi:MAG: hypothetical protein KJ709_08865 [Nanoarchaeota archaeon]|nr:hypothetical protein [Nanoarchaeota archaeon]
MNPEKEIMNWWLNKKGFFVMNSVKVSGNKEVDIFAIRLADGRLVEAIHIETAVSVTQTDSFSSKDYEAKFKDKAVTTKVTELIEQFVGKSEPYKRMLILGLTRKKPELEGIEINYFEDILADVIHKLDKQFYRSSVVRSLQLIKYVLLSNPKLLATLIRHSGSQKILKQKTRESFVKELFSQSKVKRILGKEAFEGLLISLLKESTLTKPEHLVDALVTEVLTPRTRKRFIKLLLEHKDTKPIAKEILKPKGIRSLKYFLKN